MTALTRFKPFQASARVRAPALFDDPLRNVARSPVWRETRVAALEDMARTRQPQDREMWSRTPR